MGRLGYTGGSVGFVLTCSLSLSLWLANKDLLDAACVYYKYMCVVVWFRSLSVQRQMRIIRRMNAPHTVGLSLIGICD